jgi:hypothetical protein
MPDTLTKLTFGHAEQVVRESLELDNDVQITGETKLVALDAESIDILDIYDRVGMSLRAYTSGERINQKAKNELNKIAAIQNMSHKRSHFYRLAACQTAKELINQLTVNDLVTIQNYRYEKENIGQVGVA